MTPLARLRFRLHLRVYTSVWDQILHSNSGNRHTSSRKGDRISMSGVYKITELVGTSPVSFSEAAKAAVAEAAKTIRHMDWLEVVGHNARIREGKIEEFQVTVKIGFKIER